jgi:hypothetical protein
MVKRESDFVRLLTYDLFSLNFPIADYMLLPSFTDPYGYHVGIRIDLQCVSPELHYNLAEFVMFGSYVLIMQGKARLEIKISIHKYGVGTLPAITKYLLKLIHVLCYEKPS